MLDGSEVIQEQVSVEKLQKAIVIWEATLAQFRSEMERIKREHKFTWYARREFWNLDKQRHKYFSALIKRRIQLQTAIKDQQS